MKIVGREPLMAAKVPALPLLGAEALEYGQTRALIVGIIVHELLCLFLGVIYAHFTGTNHLGALFGVGITWGIFGWIFISNLFSPSWRDVFVAGVPSGAAFVAWIVFGIVLTSVAFFDRLLRGSSQGR